MCVCERERETEQESGGGESMELSGLITEEDKKYHKFLSYLGHNAGDFPN